MRTAKERATARANAVVDPRMDDGNVDGARRVHLVGRLRSRAEEGSCPTRNNRRFGSRCGVHGRSLERKLEYGRAGCYLEGRTHRSSESMDQRVETRAVDGPWTREAWNHTGRCAGQRFHPYGRTKLRG
mmetsp:Transcript_1912/g.11785  ORF Transcript_1912/g.11785 Transcript_1912/m.11785 type:complete len:129 (-) Transcript_1912:1399-1785(-)